MLWLAKDLHTRSHFCTNTHISTILTGDRLQLTSLALEKDILNQLLASKALRAESLRMQLQATGSCKSLGQRRLYTKLHITKETRLKRQSSLLWAKSNPPCLKLEPGKPSVKTCHSGVTAQWQRQWHGLFSHPTLLSLSYSGQHNTSFSLHTWSKRHNYIANFRNKDL